MQEFGLRVRSKGFEELGSREQASGERLLAFTSVIFAFKLGLGFRV